MIAAHAAAQSPDSLDPTFSAVGIVTTPSGSGVQDLGLALARHSDGKLVMAGGTGGSGVFGSVPVASGDSEADWARAVVVQPDGKIAVGGYADQGTSGFDFDFDFDNNPEVKGAAEASATVRLYTTSGCSGSPAATGTGSAFASPGLTVSVASDSSTTFRAKATDVAGDTSARSASSIPYVEDSTAPARPTMTDTDPDSPSSHNDPEVMGAGRRRIRHRGADLQEQHLLRLADRHRHVRDLHRDRHHSDGGQ